MKRIGIERGKSFDIDKLDPAVKKGLESAKEDALALMAWKVKSLGRIANGWLIRQRCDAAGERLLVGHAIRGRRLPSPEQHQPLRRQQLDAFQV
jgi:hypothetical protein